ncbi:MAG TPA: histidinol-phosphate transaminase [Acidimicrobiia bacterium]
MVRLRAVVGEMPDYRPGRSAAAAAAEHGIDGAVKLSSNEVPFAPPPSVRQAIADAASEAHRYPDDGGEALCNRLAVRAGLEAGQVAVGAGSVALCQQALLAAVDPGDEVVWSWPSFEAYPVLARHVGATVRAAPLRDHVYDLDAMAASINRRTRLVVVCDPNNPTGTVVDHDELRHLVDGVPDDVLVLVDEAYVEFVTADRTGNGLDLVRDHANVLVLRTFSKAYGLAGLRVGYAFGHEDVISALRRTRLPFAVSTTAQAAALAALAAEAEYRGWIEALVDERERIVRACRNDLGIAVPDSQANFVWLPLGDLATGFGAACERRGVVLRPFPGLGVRATVGTAAENDRLLAAVEGSLEEIRG